MSANGFTVAYTELGELAQKLADLRGEFDKGSDAIDPLLHALSDDDLRRELSQFARNWSDKRAQLTKRLDEVAGFAKAAADTYRAADEEGAAAFSGRAGR